MSIVEDRINAIYNILDAKYQGGAGMSSSSKGTEREDFVNAVLKDMFTPHYRFSSGDIVDKYANQTGQVDVVLEQPRSYSFPVTSDGPRLYLAESVAIVIEIKSNLRTQWDEVLETSEKVANIKRKYFSENLKDLLYQAESGLMQFSEGADSEQTKRGLRAGINDQSNIGEERIKFFAVGYTGWKQSKTIKSKLIDNQIDGILQIDKRVFCTKLGRAPGFEIQEGYKSLLDFLHWLEIYFEKVPNRWIASSSY